MEDDALPAKRSAQVIGRPLALATEGLAEGAVEAEEAGTVAAVPLLDDMVEGEKEKEAVRGIADCLGLLLIFQWNPITALHKLSALITDPEILSLAEECRAAGSYVERLIRKAIKLAMSSCSIVPALMLFWKAFATGR